MSFPSETDDCQRRGALLEVEGSFENNACTLTLWSAVRLPLGLWSLAGLNR